MCVFAAHHDSFRLLTPHTPIIRIYLQVRGQSELRKNRQTAVITAGIDLESILRATRILKLSCLRDA